jgi:hypothetical protein
MALIPEDDSEFLDAKGFQHEILESGGEVHVILRRFPFHRYAPQEADLLIRLLPGYPQTAVDMFFTIPDVKLPSGAFPKNCDQHPVIGGKLWQQWSRHLTWRSGIDDLRSFLAATASEIGKGI